MKSPEVTIVMNPRDRFSYTDESIELLYKYTNMPFHLIFVDGNFPEVMRKKIDRLAKEKNFQVIRVDRFLSPNEAKNLAIPYLKGKYSIWIDNDCRPVNQGAIDNLVRAAEETGADLVGPLVCEGWPEPEFVHFLGGFNHIEKQMIDGKEEKVLVMTHEGTGLKIKEVEHTFSRQPSEVVEPHCFLLRADMFKRIGRFDPKVIGSRDHIDISLEVSTRGGKIIFEPTARVRFLPVLPLGPPHLPMDMDYYCLRWSDDWWIASLDRLREKWDIAKLGYLAQRYADTGWRRRDFIVTPIMKKWFMGIPVPGARNLINKWVQKKTEKIVREYKEKAATAA